MHAKFSLLCVLLVFSVALAGPRFTQAQPAESAQAETQAVKDTIRSFFDALSAFDFQSVRDLATEDFTAIENGTVLTLEEFIGAGQKLEAKGASLTYDEFSDVEVTVEGTAAWVIHKNRGVMEAGDRRQEIDWTESFVLRKEAGGWKVAMLHSTVDQRR